MVENEICLISGIKIYKQTILEDYAATIQYGHIEMASWIK